MTQNKSSKVPWSTEWLRCPICSTALHRSQSGWSCQGATTPHNFPDVRGVPILINESNSMFRLSDFVEDDFVMGTRPAPESLKSRILSLIPSTGENRTAEPGLRQMRSLLLEDGGRPIVLVIGGGTLGTGMEVLAEHPTIDILETDVSLAARTQIVCDGHDLPFTDGIFDGVVIQAVLEHVADPPRVVSEIRRVLRPGGIVYAETPFMQQVHNGPYDFTRYTHIGHRRLFRWFEEIDSGPIGGPGIALSWSIDYFLRSLAPMNNRRAQSVLGIGARLGTWWLKYVDRWIGSRPQAFNAGWAYYFLGRSSEIPIADRDLIVLYRGRPS